MPIRKSFEVSPDKTTVRRSMPKLSTGMDESEEAEVHIQRAIHQQAERGTVDAIPVPMISEVEPAATELLEPFQVPVHYIRHRHVAWDDVSQPRLYDMDAADLDWLEEHKRAGRRVSEDDFELLIDMLEKYSHKNPRLATVKDVASQLPPTISESFAVEIVEYWQAKREKWGKPLVRAFWPIPDYDNPNPRVAFRPTERSYSRRTRPNDVDAFDKMRNLRRDIATVQELLTLVREREQLKMQIIRAHIEVFRRLCHEDKQPHQNKLVYYIPRPRPPPRPHHPTQPVSQARTPRAAASDEEHDEALQEAARAADLALFGPEGMSAAERLAAQQDKLPIVELNRPGLRHLYMHPTARVRLPGATHRLPIVEIDPYPMSASDSGASSLPSSAASFSGGEGSASLSSSGHAPRTVAPGGSKRRPGRRRAAPCAHDAPDAQWASTQRTNPLFTVDRAHPTRADPTAAAAVSACPRGGGRGARGAGRRRPGRGAGGRRTRRGGTRKTPRARIRVVRRVGRGGRVLYDRVRVPSPAPGGSDTGAPVEDAAPAASDTAGRVASSTVPPLMQEAVIHHQRSMLRSPLYGTPFASLLGHTQYTAETDIISEWERNYAVGGPAATPAEYAAECRTRPKYGQSYSALYHTPWSTVITAANSQIITPSTQ